MNAKNQDLVQSLIKETQHLKTKLQIAEQNIVNLKQALQIQSRNNSKSPTNQPKQHVFNNYYSNQSTNVSHENLLDCKQIQMVKQLHIQIDSLKMENAQQKNKIEKITKQFQQLNEDHCKLRDLYDQQQQLLIEQNNINSQLIEEIAQYKQITKKQQSFHEVSFQERTTLSNNENELNQFSTQQQHTTICQPSVEQEIQCNLNLELPYTKDDLVILLEKAENQINLLLAQ